MKAECGQCAWCVSGPMATVAHMASLAVRTAPSAERAGAMMPVREVTQTILIGDQEGVPGNCLQAAIASVLDLPIEAVPHFVTFLWFDPAVELWARGRGLTVKRQGFPDRPPPGPDVIPEQLCIVSGYSPRGSLHSVVGGEGRIIWDPHPSRDGLVNVSEVEWFEEWDHSDTKCWICGTPTEGGDERTSDGDHA